MKKLIILLILSFLSFSCEKENFVPDSEIPDWLKGIITQNETTLKSNKNSPVGITAWVRYKHLEDYYFEHINPISSLAYVIYDWEGNLVQLNHEFLKELCCKQYVWKGSSYFLDQ